MASGTNRLILSEATKKGGYSKYTKEVLNANNAVRNRDIKSLFVIEHC